MAHLAKRVREKELAELITDLKKLEDSLEGTLTTQFKNWGTEVEWVGFTDFAEVPTQFRVFGIGDHASLLAARRSGRVEAAGKRCTA